MQSTVVPDAFDGAQFAVRHPEIVCGRGELDAVALGKAAHLLAEHGNALLPARIVDSFRAVLQFDCEPVGCSIDPLHLSVPTLANAGLFGCPEWLSTSPTSYRAAHVRARR